MLMPRQPQLLVIKYYTTYLFLLIEDTALVLIGFHSLNNPYVNVIFNAFEIETLLFSSVTMSDEKLLLLSFIWRPVTLQLTAVLDAKPKPLHVMGTRTYNRQLHLDMRSPALRDVIFQADILTCDASCFYNRSSFPSASQYFSD